MQDRLIREITINASQQAIYQAIADPERVVRWFPDKIEGQYAVGERAVLGFGSECRSKIYIVDAKPFEYFAFRWVPGGKYFTEDVLAVPNTLVEFHIIELSSGGCLLRLSESGFASLPAEIAEQSVHQNAQGWDFMLSRLDTYIKAQ